MAHVGSLTASSAPPRPCTRAPVANRQADVTCQEAAAIHVEFVHLLTAAGEEVGLLRLTMVRGTKGYLGATFSHRGKRISQTVGGRIARIAKSITHSRILHSNTQVEDPNSVARSRTPIVGYLPKSNIQSRWPKVEHSQRLYIKRTFEVGYLQYVRNASAELPHSFPDHCTCSFWLWPHYCRLISKSRLTTDVRLSSTPTTWRVNMTTAFQESSACQASAART